MGVQYPVGLFRVRRRRPVVAVERAADEDPVRAGEHVAGADVAVIDLGLRQQHFQLSRSGIGFSLFLRLFAGWKRKRKLDQLGGFEAVYVHHVTFGDDERLACGSY